MLSVAAMGLDAGELLAEAAALDAAGADSLWIESGESLDAWMVLGAVAAVTRSARLGVLGGGDGRGVSTLDWLSRGRVALEEAGWVRLDPPVDRAAWKRQLAEAGEGVAGVLVAWDPKLVDLLRNPDQEEDRQDVHLAQG
ncbi:MAG TPA: hypothetical protein VF134_06935 [Candidatus Dormibacteraeota bacterium]